MCVCVCARVCVCQARARPATSASLLSASAGPAAVGEAAGCRLLRVASAFPRPGQHPMASASAQPAALSAEQAKGEDPSLGVGRLQGEGTGLFSPSPSGALAP